MIRHGRIGVHAELTQKRQCVLAGVSRTTVYAKRKPVVFIEVDEALKRLIDEEYTRHPFYGSRKMVVHLFRSGHRVNRKRVQRLMRSMFLAAMAPGPNTSAAHPQHKVHPYFLRGVPVVRANQVWSTDITYVRLERGFRLPGGRDRLVLPAGSELAYQQQHGSRILRGLPGRRLA
jgi:putative transposase